MFITGRPEESEYSPEGGGYVSLVNGDDIIRVVSAPRDAVAALISSMDEGMGNYAYAPGKWTIKEILLHIADSERIFAYRALCIARGDQAAFPGFEQNDYVPASGANDRSLADLLQEFHAVRASTIALFSGLPREAWLRRGNANGHSVTPRGIAFQLAGHELHHAAVLRSKYLQRG